MTKTTAPAAAPAQKQRINRTYLDLAIGLLAVLIGKSLKKHGASDELAAAIRNDLSTVYRLLSRPVDTTPLALRKLHPEFASFLTEELRPGAGA